MSNTYTAETTVAIIGGGPIGIEMAIALKRLGVDNILLEARQVGDAFMRWPPSTHFFSTPEHVALAGVPVHTIDQRSITGEQYLAYLRTLVEMFDLRLHNYEPVTHIAKMDGGFIVTTRKKSAVHRYRATHVVLATGGMEYPRLLNIPGEDLPHVSHYFKGPHPYFRTRLLIVGGRNSAVEAALRCWRAGVDVAISYRRESFDFDRIKPHLAGDIRDRIARGEIAYYPSTVPVRITEDYVELAPVGDAGEAVHPNGNAVRHAADFVLLATGFNAEMGLFEIAGVTLQGREKAPVFDEETMETNVPGLFVAGTAAGGTQYKTIYFISTSHDHVARIARAITGKIAHPLGTVPARNNAVTWEEVKAN